MDGLTFECKMEVISCMAGVVQCLWENCITSFPCVLAWCRKHPSNCGIHGVQRIFEQIRTIPLFACNYKASSLIVLLRFWASFSIKDIHGRLLTNDSSSNVSLKNQHLHLSLFIVYAWDQETSWLCYIFLLFFWFSLYGRYPRDIPSPCKWTGECFTIYMYIRLPNDSFNF